MATGSIAKKPQPRKHNPEILRFKRIARALQIPWQEVCQLRDRLAGEEQESRQSADDIRQVGWEAHCRLNGWSKHHHPFWRNGFTRYFGKRIAKGDDYTEIVPRYDEIASSVREQCEEARELDASEIFEILLSDYPTQTSVLVHYGNALAELAYDALRYDTPF